MASWKEIVLSGSSAHLQSVTGSLARPLQFPNITDMVSERTPLVIDANGNVGRGDADYGTATLDFASLTSAASVGNDLFAFADITDGNTVKKITFDSALSGSGISSMAFQASNGVSITGGTIGSGTTISKSPVITLGGDLTGTATLTNLGNATLTATIAAAAVENTMLNNNIFTNQTPIAGGISADDSFIIYDKSSTSIKSGSMASILTYVNANASFGTGDVTSGTTIADNRIVRGDGGSKGIQQSGITIDDSDNITGVNNLTVNGDLTVNGTTTTVNTANLNVEDQIVLLNDSSTAVARDGGIVIQQGTNDSGKGLVYDLSADAWGIQSALSSTAITVTPNAYLATVESSTSNPSGNPVNGGATGYGQLHINTSTNKAFIFV